ncbi:hypothetical protein [Streptomyces sp. NPDC001401]|uniref:hypothetical protein n=1 Tax=Streptomyces sp. NPDC001401 TaxID=3364570 RepID=UPI0036CB6F04
MIRIEYRQTGPYVDQGQENREEVDLALVSRSDLRWYDFLWSMKGALEHLERGERTTIGFTENAELIDFVPEDDKVRVACTYAAAEAVCERVDLRNAWLLFQEAVLTRLGVEYPRLMANPVFAELQI